MDKTAIIRFNKNSQVEYSFWNTFLNMTGTWVKNEVAELNPDYKNVKEWETKESLFTELRRITEEFDKKDQQDIRKVFEFFLDYDLWETAWIALNFSAYDECKLVEWDRNQLSSCMGHLKENQSWYGRFMLLYCKYLYCKVGITNELERERETEALLNMIQPLAAEEGWTLALCELAARICQISKTESKFAINYYNHILKTQKRSDIYYNIGQIYEENYGYLNKAKDFYTKANDLNLNNYKAVYKIAESKEREKNNNIDALCLYSNAFNLIAKEKSNDPISDANFYMYSLKRMIDLTTYKLNLPDLRTSLLEFKSQIKAHPYSKIMLTDQILGMVRMRQHSNLKDFPAFMEEKKLLVCIEDFLKNRAIEILR